MRCEAKQSCPKAHRTAVKCVKFGGPPACLSVTRWQQLKSSPNCARCSAFPWSIWVVYQLVNSLKVMASSNVHCLSLSLSPPSLIPLLLLPFPPPPLFTVSCSLSLSLPLCLVYFSYLSISLLFSPNKALALALWHNVTVMFLGSHPPSFRFRCFVLILANLKCSTQQKKTS